MREWRCVRHDAVFAIHEMQLARHGGLDGIRDRNAIESALARPLQLNAYGDPPPDAAALASAYADGFARNPGFCDGNKRTAWVVARLFLADNSVSIEFAEIEAIQMMVSVAAGELTESQMVDWFRLRTR